MPRTWTLRGGMIVIVAALVVAAILVAWLNRPRSSAPEARGGVVIALGTDVSTLDPHMTANVPGDLSVLSHIYPALTVRAPDLSLQPSLARSWTALSPTRWRFSLVPGAAFANGEPLDAAAVKWNIERVLATKTHARIRLWFTPIKTVAVIDATTLEIETAAPFPGLPAQMSMLFLLPPQWARTHNPAREAASGGPYVLTEHVAGDHITLKRNPRYFGPASAFDTVEFRTIPSPTARVASLMAGETDLVTAIPLPEVKRLSRSGQVDAGSIPGIRSVFIKLNTLKAPLNDVRVRRALNLAIDKRAIATDLFDGKAPVSQCQLLTPEYLGFNPALRPIPDDPAEARRLLTQAGVRPGTTLDLEIPANNALQGGELAQVVASQLEAVGLKVRLVQMDTAYYMDKYVKSKSLGDLSVLTYAWPTIDADGVLSFFQSQSPYAYYADPELDRLLPLARTETDPAARTRLYSQITARFCDQAPVIFLYAQPYSFASSHRIRWQVRPDDWVRAMDMAPAR